MDHRLTPLVLTLANEFATVEVIVDDLANGPTLVLHDPASGRQISLDPLELQTLAWSRHEHLRSFMHPGFKEQYLDRIDPASAREEDLTRLSEET